MRIIGGLHRGRRLVAPAGATTRPTADRVRQALFDMLWHAPWGGREAIEGAVVLDAFAGTGALGLEALSRGAASAHFIENDRAALAALRANIAACDEAARCRVLAGDATKPPRAPQPCTLVFLDPPYARRAAAAAPGLLEQALAALAAAGWIAPGALVSAEYGTPPEAPPPGFALLATRAHGAAHLSVMRAGPPA
ncbi:DNA methyltransferase [Siccirubricoccus deserti]|uniref:16S rRNA (Guanine(966)-N(2))-methyltransferase RsmD n=1 Tax=Siccirubricoccus deserti TaxID=2013562 RepID=A0A9X0UD92_9PROT|nr:16S rRNA (guanine(966)-N(2))-methyltransferase RsmD [Siccirubricoccus deserti]MBC4016137.1 16S rRNA (guanine(966)-N(2))-methyltransferase RsmD [Siccirubricoccus deserti]GGC45753.1 DNA methyltransferase [Siccirubricoccus deserti]